MENPPLFPSSVLGKFFWNAKYSLFLELSWGIIVTMDVSDKITAQINEVRDWRGDMLKELRQLINETAPELEEGLKWGVPVWSHNGLVCAISDFKDHVKMNFFKGAYLADPKKLFNSGLDSKEHRSINFNKEDKPDKPALKNLLKEAVAYNLR